MVELFVLLFLLILVSMPAAVVQLLINTSKITINSASLFNLTDNEVSMRLNMTLKVPFNRFKLRLTPTNLILDYQNRVGTCKLKSIELGNKFTHIETTLKIADRNSMYALSKDLLLKKQAKIKSYGVISFHNFKLLGNRVFSLKKIMVFEGLDQMNQMTIRSINISEHKHLKGLEITASVELYNPANTHISLGKVYYYLKHQGSYLGLVKSSEINLISGKNNIKLKGRLFEAKDNSTLNSMNHLVSAILGSRPVHLEIEGDGVSPKVEWLDDAIKKHNINVTYQEKKRSLLSSISFENISTVFDEVSPYRPITSGYIVAKMDLPYKIKLNILKLKQKTKIYYPSSSKNNQLVTLNMPYSDSYNLQERVYFRFDNVPMKLVSNKELVFHEFVSRMILKENVRTFLSGNVTALVETNVGKLTLSEVPFNVTAKFPGLNGLLNPPPKIEGLHISGSRDGYLHFDSTVILTNPTKLDCDIGDLRLQILYNDTNLGSITLQGLYLNRGKNRLLSSGKINLTYKTVKGERIIEDFMSKYVGGAPLKIDALGTRASTNVSSLKYATSKLKYSMSVPTLNDSLILATKFSIFYNGAYVKVKNPFDGITIRIVEVHATAYRYGDLVAIVDRDFRNSSEQTTIRPKSNTLLFVPVIEKGLGFGIIKDGFTGNLYLNYSVRCYVEISTNGFWISLNMLNFSTSVGL